MAELPRAGVEEVDAAVARAKQAFTGLAGGRARRRAGSLHRARRRARGAARGAGDARGAQRRQADLRRPRRDRDGRRDLPLLRGRARAAARRDDPGRRRRRHDLPRAARRRRADRALELPAGDRLVEGRPGARRRQHGRAEARRADPADGARAGADRARGRASPRACSTSSPGPGSVCGARLVEHPDVAKIAFTGSTEVGRGIAAGRRGDDQAGDARARAASRPTSSSPTPTSRRPPRRRRSRSSATPARTAARARGSSSSAPPSTSSWRRSRTRSKALRVGDPLDEETQMGPLISADQREKVASYVDDDAPVAIRGSAPDGPGFWFPPTVLAPVSNDDRAAARGDLRPGRLRDPVRGRGRGGADRQRHDLRALGLDLDRATARRRCASRARSRPA